MPLFTSPAGRQKKYCGSGWSDEGIEFFNNVWMQWKTISKENGCDLWTLLKEDWVEYAEENKFGCTTYNHTKKTPKENSRINSPGIGIQDLPANCFSLEGEEDFKPDRPWKRNRLDSDNNSDDSTGDREENRTKGKRIHWVSNNSVDAPEEYDNGEDDNEEDDGENDERHHGEYEGV